MDKKIEVQMLKKDFKSLEKTMRNGISSDFIYEDAGHSLGFDQMFKQLSIGLGGFQQITFVKYKVLDLKESGINATATMEHTVGGKIGGSGQKIHMLVSTGKSIDDYSKIGDHWMMTKMKWKDFAVTMDGKPMPAPK